MANEKNIHNYTAADIEKYHQGLLSAKERHDLEKAALDDPFLADALEGYAVEGVNRANDINELKERLAEKVEEAKVIPMHPQQKPMRVWLRIAAMLVLIAGAGFLVYQFAFDKKQPDEIAIRKTESPATIPSLEDTASTSASGLIHSDSNKSPMAPVTQNEVTTETTEGKGNVVSKLAPPTAKEGSIRKDTLARIEVADDKANTIVSAPPKVETEKAVVRDEIKTLKKDVAAGDVKLKNASDSKREQDKNIAGIVAPSSRQKTEEGYTLQEMDRRDNAASNRANIFRGRVTDADNNGLPFANVTSTEDNVGTYADARGYFNLTSPDTVMKVQVRSIGFNDNNTQLRNNVSNNQIVLQEDKSLPEIVISNKKVNAEARSRNAFMKVEEPEPADGWDNYDTYLANNLKIPDTYKPKQEASGTVSVSFEVDKHGEPTNIKIEKSLCIQCDKEAIRLVKEGPRWKRNVKKGRTTVTIKF